jgi:deoxyribose-phosphate aldolase
VSAEPTRAALARRIDHTLLAPETTPAQIERLCSACLEQGYFAACVEPGWVGRCARRLAGGKTVVVAAIGLGQPTATAGDKALQAKRAMEDGAAEVDMIVDLASLIAGDKNAVVSDIAAVIEAAKRVNEDAIVKVILETPALNNDQIIFGCRCAAEAQADFVGAGGGLHSTGAATIGHVALLRKHSAPIGVKAGGLLDDPKTALEMIEAGADRLGVLAGGATDGTRLL